MNDLLNKLLKKHKKLYTIPKKKLDIETRAIIKELREITNKLIEKENKNQLKEIEKIITEQIQQNFLETVLPELNQVTAGIKEQPKPLIPSTHPLHLSHLSAKLEIEKAKIFVEQLAE